jgi:hypothetical protein
LRYLYGICALVGAVVGFLVPAAKASSAQHPGILGNIIAFELNYINLIATVGTVWLLYYVFVRKVRGREALVMYGALGFVSVRLILASLRFFHH